MMNIDATWPGSGDRIIRVSKHQTGRSSICQKSRKADLPAVPGCSPHLPRLSPTCNVSKRRNARADCHDHFHNGISSALFGCV